MSVADSSVLVLSSEGPVLVRAGIDSFSSGGDAGRKTGSVRSRCREAAGTKVGFGFQWTGMENSMGLRRRGSGLLRVVSQYPTVNL